MERETSNAIDGLRLLIGTVSENLYFAHTEFNFNTFPDVFNKKYAPPIKPVIKSVDDTSNFDDYNEEFAPEEADASEFELFDDF